MAVTTRAFGLRDLPLVEGLQRIGTYLDLESTILEPIQPLAAAVYSLAGQAVGRQGRITYVINGREDGRRVRGFVQVSMRPSRPEGDILYLAPSLERGQPEVTPELWQRLLSHACQDLGARQRQRVFARLPAEASDAIEVFRHVGFMVYAQEHVFRLDRSTSTLPPVSLTLRPYQTHDNWGVQRLFCHAAPRLVQQIECTPGSGWALPSVARRRAAQRYVWQKDNEVRGYVSVRRGVYGVWLKVLVDHDDDHYADDLLAGALAQIGPITKPLYCSVRGYEPGLQHAAQRVGFRLQTSQLLLAKPTVVPVKESILTWRPVPERGVEAAPTTSLVHAQAHVPD